MGRKKITIVGAGKVGSTAAQLIAYKELGDVILWNRTAEKAEAVAIDLKESLPAENIDIEILGTNDFTSTENSDIIAITAGMRERNSQKWEDFLTLNALMLRNLIWGLKEHSPTAILIIVTDPADVMGYLAYKISEFEKNRVMGLAGTAHSKLRSFVAEKLKVSVKDVSALVFGSYRNVILFPENIYVGGAPLKKLLGREEIQEIVQKTLNAGEGSLVYAPAYSLVQMIEAIVKDNKKVLPCAAYLEKEYGISGIFFGVPAKLGSKGIENIIEIGLSEEQMSLLKSSAEKIKKSVNFLKSRGFFNERS